MSVYFKTVENKNFCLSRNDLWKKYFKVYAAVVGMFAVKFFVNPGLSYKRLSNNRPHWKRIEKFNH
jgi:hypothetical protein